jgi:hypothetical protein
MRNVNRFVTATAVLYAIGYIGVAFSSNPDYNDVLDLPNEQSERTWKVVALLGVAFSLIVRRIHVI